MSTTFRACYYVTPDGQGSVCLTTPEQSELPESDLREAAMAEARRPEVGLVNPDTGFSEEEVRAGLHVGEWRDMP